MMKIQKCNKYIALVIFTIFLFFTIQIYSSYAAETETYKTADTNENDYKKELQELEKTINELKSGNLSLDDLLSDEPMFELTKVENPNKKIPLQTRVKETIKSSIYQSYVFIKYFVTKNLVYIIITIVLILFKAIIKKRGD